MHFRLPLFRKIVVLKMVISLEFNCFFYSNNSFNKDFIKQFVILKNFDCQRQGKVKDYSRRILIEAFEFSSILIKKEFQYNMHITAFFIFGNFEILGERSILVNVFWVNSNGFVQHTPH